MSDYWRETFSYFGLLRKTGKVKKVFSPEYFSFGEDREQYFLYYEPKNLVSEKIIVWIHGGGWNAGNPKFFDYVGQCVAGAGYRFVSIGYRLSTKFKWPCQIDDVCSAFNASMDFLRKKNIDTSKVIVVGPSAGAHLSSIMCYSKEIQERNGVDVSNVVGYIGFGGPYSFRDDSSLTLKLLVGKLFKKGDSKKNGEPVSLMSKSHIPMLLIQSRHDGLVPYGCAEDFAQKAASLGTACEIYSVEDKKNTHSWYTAGVFACARDENKTLDKFFSWIEGL